MSFPDQAWDAALENWQPTGSFHESLPTPTFGPAGGTLVSLPCINQEWVMLIMGCLTQMQQPAAWGPVADSIRDQLLSWVTQLQEMIWSAVDNPCCNVAMRLTATCELQFSTNGGTSWTTVDGWDSNLGGCVRSNLPVPVPPNPGGVGVNQHACNIAGYLATEIIKVAMAKVVAYVGTTGQQIHFATDILATIGYAFPITYAASIAFQDWYSTVSGEVLSQVTTARDDPALWSLVTCSIYNAIKGTGYVTAANFADVHTNLAAMSYTYAWVPSVIAAWWNDMGLTNIQQAQNVGALDVVDCSGCGTYCYEIDYRLSNGSATSYTPGVSTWTSGVGWVGSYQAGESPPAEDVGIDQHLTAIQITGVTVHYITNAPQGTAVRQIYLYYLGTQVSVSSLDPGAWPTGNTQGVSYSGFVDEVIVIIRSQATSAQNIIQWLKFTGNGPNPFGSDNCTP